MVSHGRLQLIKIKLNVNKALDKKISNALEDSTNKIIDNAVETAIEELKRVTPKDTGYAASRWTSYKQESFKISFSLSNKFLISLTESSHYINNDAEYITYLNAGWSKQAPSYFIEQTLMKSGFEPTII
jgi:hypothetical protein